jgi:ABC-type spermidine/putrescine transport system permease subunit I
MIPIRTSQSATSPALLAAPVALFLAVVFLVPLGYVVVMSLSEPSPGLGNFIDIFRSPVFFRVLFQTFTTAFTVTILTLLISYPLAYAAANGSKGLAAFLLTVVALSFWTSFLVRTYAWMVILGTQGPVSDALAALGWSPPPRMLFTTFSATVAMTHALVPFMMLALFAVMNRIDRRLVQAAANLGAPPVKAFLTVYLPLSAPGVVNGCTLVFIMCLGFYVMPVLLGSPSDQMIAGVIGDQIEQMIDFGLASAMSIVLLAITLILYAIYNRFVGLDRLWR